MRGFRHFDLYHSWSGFTVNCSCRSAAHAAAAALAASSVVMQVTPCETAAARIFPSSVREPLPDGVLIT